MGPDADNEAIQLGLTTLRTWWQHRRKGESGSAIAALGTEKMKGVVEGYTRHFFTLAHCIVVNDRVQPPRGLSERIKELEKKRSKEMSARPQQPIPSGVVEPFSAVNAIHADLTDPNLTPLEKLHVAKRRQFENSANSGLTPSLHGLSASLSSKNGYNENSGVGAAPMLPAVAEKCIPGKVDIPGLVDAVSQRSTQLAHRGFINGVGSGSLDSLDEHGQPLYGDPNLTPVVFVSSNGDIQIAMKVDGITCAHCVKIVETVLRGCNGNKSPISGLLDAAADEKLGRVLLKIDEAAAAKRIAFEAARNLGMVGYIAEPMNMSIVGSGADPVAHADLGALATAFEVVATTEASDMFDWSIPCTCPDNGILRGDCKRYVHIFIGSTSFHFDSISQALHCRHSQMNKRMFDAFSEREQQVTEYMAGCGMKYGMDCTCGPTCRCKNCPLHEEEQKLRGLRNMEANSFLAPVGITSSFDYASSLQQGHGIYGSTIDNQQKATTDLGFSTFNQQKVGADLGFTAYSNAGTSSAVPFNQDATGMFSMSDNVPESQQQQDNLSPLQLGNNQQNFIQPNQQRRTSRARNSSIMSYGNRNSVRDGNRGSVRGMSITSETTFGRAMSGLSALSIDWENLDDFDLDVDHSAHINQAGSPSGGARRSSATRRSILSTGSQDGGNGTQVSFKV